MAAACQIRRAPTHRRETERSIGALLAANDHRLSAARHQLFGHPVLPGSSAPLTVGLPHRLRIPAPGMRTHGRVYTFRTRETRTGPGALFTPGTAVSAGHRVVRGRRLPPLSGRFLLSRHSHPARDVDVTRHQQGFPDSRPIPVLPLACGRHGWSGGPWAFPRAPHPAGQEPATHVTAGTGRTQTRSYVSGISQTSSTSSLTTCDLVSQQHPPAAPRPEAGSAATATARRHHGSGSVPGPAARSRRGSDSRISPGRIGFRHPQVSDSNVANTRRVGGPHEVPADSKHTFHAAIFARTASGFARTATGRLAPHHRPLHPPSQSRGNSLLSARATRLAKSRVLRLTRSTLSATRASAWPESSNSRALPRPGRVSGCLVPDPSHRGSRPPGPSHDALSRP